MIYFLKIYFIAGLVWSLLNWSMTVNCIRSGVADPSLAPVHREKMQKSIDNIRGNFELLCRVGNPAVMAAIAGVLAIVYFPAITLKDMLIWPFYVSKYISHRRAS